LDLDFSTALGGVKSLAAIDDLCRTLWRDYGAGKFSDDEAQSCAEAIEARRRELRGTDRLGVRAPQIVAQALAAGRTSHFPKKRRRPRPPDRQASIARRRTLAASGPMPPQLAARFTTGELAALRIVADAVRDRGASMMTIGEIASRAGVCETTARNALRRAAAEGLLTIQERRRDKRPNLPNIVRIVSREWRSWIERGRRLNSPPPAVEGRGCKKIGPTDIASSRSLRGDRALRGQHTPKVARKTPNGALQAT
jgi:hypothetical protein